MLTQKSWDRPVFTNLSNLKLVEKVPVEALQDAACWMEARPGTPDEDGQRVSM